MFDRSEVLKGPFDASAPQSVYLGFLPFFHVYGLVVLNVVLLYEGNQLVTIPRFQPHSFLGAIQKYKV